MKQYTYLFIPIQHLHYIILKDYLYLLYKLLFIIIIIIIIKDYLKYKSSNKQ